MKPANRLAGETSPYLLQHAHNPVDWYPWGEEAFETARRLDKPVFLSIGYSTCHWCHVMERESFEDGEIARLLNEAFVCIKVDREERPDLDQHYMAVCQSLTGSGGWPLTIVMTPDKRPFFAGTYFPKSRRWGRPGLLELAPLLVEAWRTRREEVLHSADGIIAALERGRAGGRSEAAGSPPSENVLDDAYGELAADFDAARGGFGSAPKFPMPHQLGFLLRYGRRTGKSDAVTMADGHARGHAPRRDLRPARVRLPPLCDRRRLARPPFREDAVRPGPSGRGLRRSGGGDRGARIRTDGGGDRGVRSQRPRLSRRRILCGRGRRQRGRRRQVLPLDPRRARGRPGPGASPGRGAGLRGRSGRQLRRTGESPRRPEYPPPERDPGNARRCDRTEKTLPRPREQDPSIQGHQGPRRLERADDRGPGLGLPAHRRDKISSSRGRGGRFRSEAHA